MEQHAQAKAEQPFVWEEDAGPALPQHPLVAGIVAEYNPFHMGHEWMIAQLRKGGVHTVVCVMSGPFVQRAEPAILPTHLRAKAALAGGADLVLRLPVPWALSSAEGFAQGGAGLLSALGCVDVLAFGAEYPDAERLQAVAEALLSDAFPALLRARLGKGAPFAAARAAAAEELLPGAGEVLRQPNNILAVEYIKALLGPLPGALRARMDADVQWRVVNGLYGKSADAQDLFMLPVPLALPRVGASHDGTPQSGFASASWLRAAAREKGVQAWRPWVPAACMHLYEKAAQEGALLDATRYEVALLSRLRGMDAEEIAGAPGAGEGLENRLAAAAQKATTLTELYALAKSKRFAHSRVRRLALCAALGLRAPAGPIPPFAQVLAANGRGIALLRRAKQRAFVPVSTSLAKLAATGADAGAAARAEAAAEDLHAMWLQTPRPGGTAYTQPAAMVPGPHT